MAQSNISRDNVENQEALAIAAAIVAGTFSTLAAQLAAASYTGGTLATLKASLVTSLGVDALTGLSNARTAVAKSPQGFNYQIK